LRSTYVPCPPSVTDIARPGGGVAPGVAHSIVRAATLARHTIDCALARGPIGGFVGMSPSRQAEETKPMTSRPTFGNDDFTVAPGAAMGNFRRARARWTARGSAGARRQRVP